MAERANGKHQVWKVKGRAMDTNTGETQDTRANPNSWETHLVRKRWDIGLIRALSPRIMMMMMICIPKFFSWKALQIPTLSGDMRSKQKTFENTRPPSEVKCTSL